ncbi:uncharacterized protein DFL_003293 [Arthrobotrys flagrans]|uniref:Clr5 domain-containing protein n=1 Tax=Arthrobotrys flagrans TaxID=97331 RepID=A0A437A1F5_ARTFL|nr:hypothetical protein DFL_003293 [Arthrobotrys flagrans]
MTYDWEKYKETLRGLYNDRMTYDDIREYMIAKHKFKASINAYKETFKKRWGWDKYNRGTISGTISGGCIVKRKSRPRRPVWESDCNTILQEPREAPSHSPPEQYNKEQENANSSSQPFQNTANTQSTQISESTHLEPNDTIGEDAWPYLETSPNWWWWKEVGASSIAGRSKSVRSPECLWQKASETPPCYCWKDFGLDGRYGYFTLPEKLRLLKSFSIISLLSEHKRHEYARDMLRILDITIMTIGRCYGNSLAPGYESYSGESLNNIYLVGKIKSRVERLHQIIRQRSARRSLDILCLGHTTLTLTLPILAFAFHSSDHTSFIRETASFVFDLLVDVKKGLTPSPRPQILEEGIERYGDIDSLPDEVFQPLNELATSYWSQYIYLILRTYLPVRENAVTRRLEEHVPKLTYNRTSGLMNLGIRVLSGLEGAEKLFGLIALIFNNKKRNGLDGQIYGTNTTAIAANWSQETPEELQQSTISKLARTTKVLANTYQKIGDTHIVLEIYHTFHRRLLYTNLDAYPRAVTEEHVDTVLHRFSTFCIEKNMLEQEIALLGLHATRLQNASEKSIIQIFTAPKDIYIFLTAFTIIFGLSIQNSRLRKGREDTIRLTKPLIELWNRAVPGEHWNDTTEFEQFGFYIARRAISRMPP